MQGQARPPVLPFLSLARSLTQLLPLLTSLRSTNFIRYSFKKDTCQLAACPDYTAKERESKRMKERQNEGGDQGEREGCTERRRREAREIERGGD